MRILPVALAIVLSVTSALADGALPPGQPAGIHQAQIKRTTELYFFGLALLAAGALGFVMTKGHDNGGSSTTATSS